MARKFRFFVAPNPFTFFGGVPSQSRAKDVDQYLTEVPAQRQPALALQKNYISFYILQEDVLNEYRPRLGGLNVGKGCIRYTKPDEIFTPYPYAACGPGISA